MIIWFVVVVAIIFTVSYLSMAQDRYNAICREELRHELHLKGELSDKQRSKDWLRTHLPELQDMIPRTIFRTKDIDALKEYLKSERCPHQFVLKNTHGSRMNVVVTNKEAMNPDALCGRARKFLSTRFHETGNTARREQLHYEFNDPKIIIEEYLGDVDDLKFHIIDGRLIFWQRMRGGEEEIFYADDASPELHQVALKIYAKINEEAKTPIRLVRVDFFSRYGKHYVGEITFSPAMCTKRRPYLFGRI